MNTHERRLEERVLLLMPSAKDAATSCDLLSKAGFACLACQGIEELCRELRAGAAVVVLTEEAIVSDRAGRLAAVLKDQPPWSGLPLVVLTRDGSESPRTMLVREATGNAILLERPIRIRTLLSVVRSSFYARLRQYEIRDHIEERRLSEERLRLSEQALRDADRRKDEFLAMLAHELRNPLAAIGNAVTLMADPDGQESSEWSMEVIGRQLRHLTGLIDDLLDVSRITQGKIRLHRQVIEVGPVLHKAIEAVKPLVEGRTHTLVVSQAPGLWLDADPMRIEQVVINLLTNAVKYTEAGGRIEISATRERDEVVFRVRDNGIGISPEQRLTMFELFAQGERSLARSEGGLGIGLTIVRSLVEMHGGSITARSEGVGEGSEFVVRLPAAERPAPTPTVPPKLTGPKEGSRRSRVLVVDDNADMVSGLARLLKRVGHEVRTAPDGYAALGLAQDFKPEAVLLDIGLPGMDGYEVARRLRQDGFAEALIIAVSGYGEEQARRRSREAGFDHHLVKPVEFEALLEVVSAQRSTR